MSPSPEIRNQDASPDLEGIAGDLFEAEVRALDETPTRRPGATYRVQLHRSFRLNDLTEVVPYLSDLGITDCYLSPYLEARPGSTHGYDIFDHRRINPEIGDEADHARLVERLERLEMGRVLDVVPNHMGVGGENRFWSEVLETGPQSPSARFFDIDWHPIKEELNERLLLPILGEQYGRALEDGTIELHREGGAFFIRYYDRKLPLSPRSYALVLGLRSGELLSTFDPDDPHLLEYRSIWATAEGLPPRTVTDPVQIEAKLREKEVIKRRIARLCDESPAIAEFIDENMARFRGTPGDPRSFDLLDRLLEEQIYRLAYWRVASEEINYRRFFDINDLAGLRTEDPPVFDAVHELIFRWVDEGNVSGLRIDHPDGLADPLGYFQRLQETLFLRACRRRLGRQDDGRNWPKLAEAIQARYQSAVEGDPDSPLARRFPIVVEKILSRGEELPALWPIDGTVGYEFLNALNGLFVDPAASTAIDEIYAEFTGDREPFPDVLYRAKQLIARWSLASEVNMLSRMLNRASELDRRSRDFTLNELRRALREVIACFPVYRTYQQPGEPVSPRDHDYIVQSIARARRRDTTVDASVYTFLQEILLGEHPEEQGMGEPSLRDAFVVRFQQTTGPMQAKGLEDTAFYRQFRLSSLNEVGADPSRFGTSPSGFHNLNVERASRWPGGLSTTATHDTKRGEDTRIRIDVLSELADEFRIRLARWSRWNARRKVEVHGAPCPDAREEYLFYQTLIGAWPFGGPDDATPPGLSERIQEYLIKAAREAKLTTSWTDPDPTYSETLGRFVDESLNNDDAAPFLTDFLPFQRRIARVGVVHSLAQTLFKIASPGVPDVYSGCELWDLSLVDPDNRRPVDYPHRTRMLAGLGNELAAGIGRADLAGRLFANADDGAIKLYLIWTALNHRKRESALYARGAYRPLDADGGLKGHVLAFARHREGQYVLAVAPRLVAGLMGDEAMTAPIGRDVWGETRLILPDSAMPGRWRNLLTDQVVEVIQQPDGHWTLDIAAIFGIVPIALLVGER